MGADRGHLVLGKPVVRKDAAEIVTGRAKYVDDVSLPGMLYGGILPSPYPHALIRSIQVEAALAIPGVEAVITHEDISKEWKGGVPPVVRILDRRLRFVGDAVALLAARTKEALDEAIDRIEVEYELLHPTLGIEQAVSGQGDPLYEEYPNNVLPGGFPAWGPASLSELRIGDVAKGFEDADVVVEGECGYESIPNALPAEPPGVIALWEDPSSVTLWVSSQAPYREREIIRRVLGENIDVRVIGLHCGGSFGSRALAWRWHCFAILLSRRTRKPVKMVMTQQQQLSTSVVRIGCRAGAKIGLKRNGRVTAISGEILVDTGYYSRTTQAQVAVGLGELQLAIRCENWDLRTKIVCTNRMASGQIRGFGGQEFKCVLFPILFRGLAEIGVDPVEFYKANFVKPGQGYFWRDGKWYVYRGIDFSHTLEVGARKFGWRRKWKGWLHPTSVNGPKRRGVGVAVHGNADVGEDPAEALVRVTPDGRATLLVCVAEFGTGQTTSLQKMVAEIFRMDLDRVGLAPADTTHSPYVGPAGGSRGTYAIGSAVIRAAKDAKQKLLKRFSRVLGIPVRELDTENGYIIWKRHPSKRVRWDSIGREWSVIGFGRFEGDYTLCNFLATFVEVEVDVETGIVDLRHVVNVTNPGRVINPSALEAQMNGCLGSAGIDSALFEESVVDKRGGWVLNCNMIDYPWRTFDNLPRIDNVVLQTPLPSHEFKAVGVGEITTSPGPVAVVMAASNALGRWVTDYPLTPWKILEAYYGEK